jgi:hypothetical protein
LDKRNVNGEGPGGDLKGKKKKKGGSFAWECDKCFRLESVLAGSKVGAVRGFGRGELKLKWGRKRREEGDEGDGKREGEGEIK